MQWVYIHYIRKIDMAFESVDAKELNIKIFSKIKSDAVEQTKLLGKEKGEAPDMEGTGKRNAHLLAIAPNANSSMITGCSPSIEPHKQMHIHIEQEQGRI